METLKSTFKNLEELEAAVGKEIAVSEWCSIEQDRIDTFAKVTEDEQWIHVDPAKAKEHSPYKDTIAHGFLVLSLIPKFSYATVKVEGAKMGVNYGCNKVRFMNATKVNSNIRGRATLKELERIEGGARYVTTWTIELEGQSKPACVADCVSIVYV